MPTILQIKSAARTQGAQSSLLADELVAKLAKSDPTLKIVVRDLLVDNLPHLDADVIGAFYTPAEQRTDMQKSALTQSDELIAELLDADIVVIAAPMYNFGISSQLKTYFDLIARVGSTFRYTDHGVEGLVQGKKVYVISTRGGQYSGTANDSQTPHLTTFLGFLGMTDVTFIYAEGLAMGPSFAEAGLTVAREAIAAAA